MTGSGGFWKRFRPLFLLGLVGVATLPLAVVEMLRSQPLPPGAPEIPLAGLVLLSLVNPVLLLAISTAVGAKLAPRLGLVSRVAERSATGSELWRPLRAEAPLALGLGLASAVAITALDLAFRPYLGDAWREAAAAVQPGGWRALVLGIGYGGITEELLVRWGLVSLFAWAGGRLAGRAGPRVLWTAIGAAALVFGAGHLPAAAAIAPLTTPLVVRTVALNALGGLVYGWLFWRRSLEAAMVAHAATHVGFALLRAVG